MVSASTTTTVTTLAEDQDASITLPASLFGGLNTTNVVGIAITFYSSSSLFPFPEDFPSNCTIGSPVIGALVGGQNFRTSNLSESITISFRLIQPVCMPSYIMHNASNIVHFLSLHLLLSFRTQQICGV